MTDTPNLVTETPGVPETARRGIDIASIILIVGVVMMIGVVGLQLSSRNSAPLGRGNPVPDFTVTSFDGETFALEALRGKVVVVNFWASWCGPCEAEAEVLETLWQQYKTEEFVLLGLTHADVERDSLAFIDRFGITYPNAPDPGARIYDMYQLTGVPETFIVAPDGTLAFLLPGPLTQLTLPQFQATINSLLGVS